MFVEQRPQDAAGHAFDEVVVVDEDAVIGGEVAHRQWRAGRARRGFVMRGLGVVRLARGLRDQRGEVAGVDDQCVLVGMAEEGVVFAFGVEHAKEAAAVNEGDGNPAVRIGQHRQRDARLGRMRCAHRRLVRIVARAVVDADGNPLARGDADEAFADLYLRADPGIRITQASQCIECGAGLVQHQQQRVADAEAGGQGCESSIGQIRQIGRVAQTVERAPQAQKRIGRRRRGRDMGIDGFDVEHPVDVRTAQHEHLVHVGLRGDAGELRLHVFEQRTCGFGAHVMQLEPEVAEASGFDHLYLRVRMREHVFACLAEELIGQRHVFGVDVMHLRGIGYIWRAIGRSGRHHCRNRTVEAGTQRFER